MPTPHSHKKPFLCARHKTLAQQNPARCRALVKRLHSEGRQALHTAQYRKAIPYLGAAFESAEILLQQETVAHSDIDRYLKLSLELIYACRKSDYPIHTPELVELVKRQLEPHYSLRHTQKLLTPLLDVAFTPMAAVDEWVQTMLALDERQQHPLH
ncbi:hypothetical protein [Gilvimarinus sp. DA14]|uniref:hypothetical protein n=1 Tax=Gilvimarinus sp. DA14 TaxID=2956798 RepID=UPI0020B66EFB|nr:hypothetical protein [Gilvimarinus sp. DA14]UTF60605.1 hypothetical protein NHM04_02070 [Gilvimarinus sp. DA14]